MNETSEGAVEGGDGRRREPTPLRLRLRRAAGFATALVLTLVLAFNGGGYDLVIRHQVGLAVWALIALGLGTGILPRARLTLPCWIALGGFGGLALLTLLSHAWTESDERTTEELARVLQYLGVILLAYLALNRRSWQGPAAGFAVAALAVPFFAVGARLFPSVLTDHLARFGFDRLSYPLGYWNGVACWGAMATAIGLAWSANATRSLVRSLALAAVPVAAVSIYLTYSRFGAGAIAIAVVAAVALSRHRWTAAINALVAGGAAGVVVLTVRSHHEIARATGDAGSGTVLLALVFAALVCAGAALLTFRAGVDRARMDRTSARLALGGAAIGLVLLAVAMHGPLDRAWHQFRNDRTPVSGNPADPTARFTSLGGTRYAVWTAAVHAFKSDPARGIGAGSFEFYWSRHGTSNEFILDAHSLYLEQAAELGVPGFVAVLTGLGGLLAAALAGRLAWRRRRDLAAGSAMIAAFIVFLVYAGVDWMWELGAVGTLAIGGAAVAGAGGLERAPLFVLGRWTRAALTALAVLVGAVQVPGLVSTERTRGSQSELARGNLSSAMKLANDAIEAESWAASPYAARAEVSERRGDLAGASRDIKQAISRDPYNWREHLLLARIHAEQGDRQGVMSELREIRRLAPRSPYLNPFSPYRQGLDRLLSRRSSASS